jgi:hypothetical protein
MVMLFARFLTPQLLAQKHEKTAFLLVEFTLLILLITPFSFFYNPPIAHAQTTTTGGVYFHTIPPFRLYNSLSVGQFFNNGTTRDIQGENVGGIPGDAEAILVNVTVVVPRKILAQVRRMVVGRCRFTLLVAQTQIRLKP